MNLSSQLLPTGLYWLADLIYLLTLGAALYSAPWASLRHDAQRRHVFLGACVTLLVLWHLRAGLYPGLNYHLLGATLLMLMFDWQLAIIAISTVLFGVTLNGSGDWPAFAINALLMGVLPVAVSYWVLRLSVRHLPHHFFVYTLFNGFFCGGLATSITVLLSTGLLGCCSNYSYYRLVNEYLPFAYFMVFGEAFFTGMLSTSMAVMRPEWLVTFDDRRYLAGK